MWATIRDCIIQHRLWRDEVTTLQPDIIALAIDQPPEIACAMTEFCQQVRVEFNLKLCAGSYGFAGAFEHRHLIALNIDLHEIWPYASFPTKRVQCGHGHFDPRALIRQDHFTVAPIGNSAPFDFGAQGKLYDFDIVEPIE